MRSLHIVLPGRAQFDLAPAHLLLACGAIAAAGLMAGYVQLLHESVARGSQWRAEQPVSSHARIAKGAPMEPAPAALRKLR